MDHLMAISDFSDCLQSYFEKNPERLPTGVDITELKVKPFQHAWTDINLADSHEYMRTMDVKFVRGEAGKVNRLYSYQIRYSSINKVIEATMIDLP